MGWDYLYMMDQPISGHIAVMGLDDRVKKVSQYRMLLLPFKQTLDHNTV